MLSVWKYEVLREERFAIDIPKGAELLTVQMQGNTAQLWALVEPDREKETRHFHLAGTGHPIGDDVLQYVGTFQTRMGLVFHLFEVVPD